MVEPVAQGGQDSRQLMSFSYADTTYPDGFDGPMLVQGEMILIPPELLNGSTSHSFISGKPVEELGSTCRICSRSACFARREPSILSDEE